MFVSIYKYLQYRIQRLVAGQYIDDLSSQVAHQHARVKELEERVEYRDRTITKQGQELYDLKATKAREPDKVWVMDQKVYTEFCKEFEPPVINHQNTPTDAAYRLGIQRVLARIGERYVSR